MTDEWKMPKEMREVYDCFGWSIEDTTDARNDPEHKHREMFCYSIIIMNDMRNARLLLTPTERDANEKLIAELKAEVKRLTGEVSDYKSYLEMYFPGEQPRFEKWRTRGGSR